MFNGAADGKAGADNPPPRFLRVIDLHGASGTAWAQAEINKRPGGSPRDRSYREPFGELAAGKLRPELHI